MKRDYATESQIADAPAGAKLNFGGNLHMRVSKAGEKVFHFRVCLDGKDTTHSIGKFPGVSLADARLIASQRQGEVVQARRKNAIGAFRKRLRNTAQTKASSREENLGDAKAIREGAGFPAFRSLEDAGAFVDGLWRAEADTQPELFFWLGLTLLIPSRTNRLRDAMWRDFNFETGVWSVRKQGALLDKSKELACDVALLSDEATIGLERLRMVTGAGEYLFPTLRRTPVSSHRYAVRRAMERAWPHYFVEPGEFSAFFECVAKKYSLFHPELVDGMLAHKAGNPADYNHGTYLMQLRALANWWAGTLSWFSVGGSNVPWGGTFVPLQPETGKQKWNLR